MSKDPILKGYLFVFIAVIATSNVYIFSKAALNEIHIAQFGFFWYGMALLWNTIFSAASKKIRLIRALDKKYFLLLFIIAMIEIASVTMFFMAINIMANPAIVSFIGNVGPIFITILGILILKERFSIVETIGMALTLAGVFIISFKSGSDLFIKGTWLVILSSLCFSVKIIIIKSYIKKIDPTILAINRSLYLFIFALIMMIYYSNTFIISSNALLNIFIGSLLGPFLTTLSNYWALQYIEASRASFLGSTKSLVVLLGAYLYFGTLPLSYQISGGIVTILGVILISSGYIRQKKAI